MQSMGKAGQEAYCCLLRENGTFLGPLNVRCVFGPLACDCACWRAGSNGRGDRGHSGDTTIVNRRNEVKKLSVVQQSN
jgi:hypothetical protein